VKHFRRKWTRKDRAHRYQNEEKFEGADEKIFIQKADHKTEQLCKQVFRAIVTTLNGECGDPVLQNLLVESVEPAPNANRLLIRVLLRCSSGKPDVVDVYERLERVRGFLRNEVAVAIYRRKAPELAFLVLPAPEVQP